LKLKLVLTQRKSKLKSVKTLGVVLIGNSMTVRNESKSVQSAIE